MKHYVSRISIYSCSIVLIFFYSCGKANNSNISDNTIPNFEKQNADTIPNYNISGIWQLDYYPDSIIVKRDIYNYSKWSSGYAYCIQIQKDSCLFIGWNCSLKRKLKKISKNRYETVEEYQYCEFKIISNNQLLMRMIENSPQKTDYGIFYDYHRTDKILTTNSIKNKISDNVFFGIYKPLVNNRLVCDSTISFLSNFKVIGINDITQYDIEVAMDLDLFIPNAFKLKDKEHIENFSFSFRGDTLFLMNFEIQRDNSGTYEGIKPTNVSEVFLKLK